jgi:hypothetical protein
MESLHRRMLVARPGQPVFEAAAHGIASVLTFPEHRGRGYATKLLPGVGERLRTYDGVDIRGFVPGPESEFPTDVSKTPVACSILYSDVGDFYAPMGWVRFPSKHLAIPFDQPPPTSDLPTVRPIALEEIPALCARDEELVRARLAQPSDSTKTRVVVVPEIGLMRWHFVVEDMSTEAIFGHPPPVRGALWSRNADGTGPRLWILIKRNYYGDVSKDAASYDENSIYVLRLVIDENGATDVTEEELAPALEAVVRVALQQGREWRTHELEIWNPSERVVGMLERRGVRGRMVDRKQGEIASVMWYGEEGHENVEWLDNEKYAWC